MCLNHLKTTPLTPPRLPFHLIHGRIVFHETSPWCQKCWGPLSCSTASIKIILLELLFLKCMHEVLLLTKIIFRLCLRLWKLSLPSALHWALLTFLLHHGEFFSFPLWDFFAWLLEIVSVLQSSCGGRLFFSLYF